MPRLGFSGDGASCQPWFFMPTNADESAADADMVQTSWDRFHRWLLSMTLCVQELRAKEVEMQHVELTRIQASPSRIIVSPLTMRSEWSEVMHELGLFQAPFTSMRFQEQVKAVRIFEIATRRDESEGLAPQQVEYVKHHFTEPFLQPAFYWL